MRKKQKLQSKWKKCEDRNYRGNFPNFLSNNVKLEDYRENLIVLLE